MSELNRKKDIIIDHSMVYEINRKRKKQGKKELMFEDFIFGIRKGKTLKEIQESK